MSSSDHSIAVPIVIKQDVPWQVAVPAVVDGSRQVLSVDELQKKQVIVTAAAVVEKTPTFVSD
jgi:hypothetical protein